MSKEMGNNKPTIKKGSLKRLFRLLFHDYPGMLAITIVCIIINAIINVLPAVYIKTLTAYIEEGLKSDWSSVHGKIISTVMIMVIFYITGLLTALIYNLLMAIITQGFLHNMRTRMFKTMQNLPVKYFDTNNHGDIMSYYTNDTDTLRQMISQGLPQIISAALTIVSLLLVMFYYSISLMLVVFIGIFIMFRITKFIGGNSVRFFKKQQDSVGKAEGYIEEIMNGQKVVKVFCHEQAVEEEFDKINEQLFRDSESANKFSNSFGPIMNNVGNILYVLTAFTGGIFICSNLNLPNISFENLFHGGSMIAPLTIPVVATYLGMTKQFTGTVNQISQQINAITMAMAGADRIFELLDQVPEADNGYVSLVNCKEEGGKLVECKERTNMWAWKHPHENKTVTFQKVAGDVVLHDVDFAYEENKPVLKNISLNAKPGQKVAFVGATGAGKTTITNLINRFYDIADGKIRYDGININKIKKADLRRSLGIVLQDVNLFTGTVMDNIRYGKLDATDDECIKAAKLANAHDFISRLPEGYQTMLTSNGANLSQGQRQLISIARAAVADPPVMILDEATSSIDTRTELLVQRGMDALMEGRTVFVIAHRLSTVQNADAIMVLDHGSIIERGTHDELIAQKGVYYQLYTGAFELE
ncbi:ABC transporter ATP-binding protein [[Clostridium] polysaccharolyticum]|uniref:ATP-binding cassette, subfamily B n=1 Tax=[Clostridium] polysaccharolyticum TaxID=29364 RepID=A0A1I0EYQ7_9FIRM|nr:ABC transporter ATP-binding protein [[Clostridium] polysaccharolyticum]SET50808.1 ATP-binding cassette, subfamily B [[Clostridium] polysaccharolyticum]